MTNDYYVYMLLDPTNYFLPFYVGKGRLARANIHLSESLKKSDNARKYHRIQKIRKQGFEPVIFYWEKNLAENVAYDLETKLIKDFGRKDYDPDGILTNICEDARPPKKFGPENYMFGRTGKLHPQFGQDKSDYQKAQTSKAHLGKKLSDEEIAKRTETRRAKKDGQYNTITWTDEQKKRVSDGKKASWARIKAEGKPYYKVDITEIRKEASRKTQISKKSGS